MPVVIDELITKFTAQDNISGVASSMGTALGSLSLGVAGAASLIGTLGVAAASAAVGGIFELGRASVSAFADLEVLKMGLNAVSGSTQEAEAAFQRLQLIARGPGLKLGEAVQSYTDLVAAGVDSATAERAITQFGNALVSVGRGAADLQGALYGVRQLVTSDIVKAEDLNIIVERVPQAAKILRDFYGTARGEDLTKKGVGPKEALQTILVGLEKLPRAAGGVKNAMDNLSDGINIALANSGEAIMKELNGPLKVLTDYITFLAESDVGKKFGENFASMLGFGSGVSAGQTGTPPMVKILTMMTALLEQVPLLIGDIAKATMDWWEAMMRFDLKGMQQAMSRSVAAPLDYSTKAFIRQQSLENQFMSFMGAPKQEAEAQQAQSIVTGQTRVLEAIETNTRPLKDFVSMVLGGGELGRAGVTQTEIAGMKGRRAPAKNDVHRAMVGLVDAIFDAVADSGSSLSKAQRLRGM